MHYPGPPSIRQAAVTALLLAVSVAHLGAQIYDPVQWTFEIEPAEASPGAVVLGRLTASIEEGWHVYSTTTPEGIPLSLGLEESEAVARWRAFQPDPEIVYDPNFQAEVEWYTGEVDVLLELEIADAASGVATLNALVRYGACDPRQCLAPKRKSASAEVSIVPGAPSIVVAIPEGYQPAKPGQTDLTKLPQTASEASAPATPVYGGDQSGLLGFGLIALAAGFVAILTPCVFPMIPIYMGSFMGGGERPWSTVARQAGLFCAGVIVLFTAIGGALSTLLGPFGLSQIGSNAWVNLLIAGVMFTFALNMLGAFEITLPSSWTTGASARSTGSGIFPTLMLSLVFTLASFGCTGPFIGTLLAGSVGEGGASMPVIGMALFATGLSGPFFLLALFPALMNRLPRSGGWLATSKRVAGIVILAIGLKYLGSVDQVFGWGILSRERFLAIWIVLFAAGGLYLWGIVRLADEGPPGGIGLTRLGIGGAFLALSISLVPGMLGGRLGELDAHIPEASATGLRSAAGGGLSWIKDDFAGAEAAARAEGKTLLVSFTGYACSNCKWMKANMFTRPEIGELVGEMVLVELYTDGFDAASEANQEFQISRFRSSSLPFYALIRPDGTVAATFSGQTRDAEQFRSFLSSTT